MNRVIHFYSDRGFPLVYWREEEKGVDYPTVLTVENYMKWYTLYLVRTDGCIEQVTYDVLEKYVNADESAYHDHDPNPEAVRRMVDALGYYMDEQAYEMMVGRWTNTYR